MSGFHIFFVLIFSDDFGEFVADMVIVVDQEEYEAKCNDCMTVEKALKETAKGGQIGNLKVDPQSLTMKAPSKTIYR